MDTKSFLKEIRSIIREEIDYALDKKLTELKKQDTQKSIKHGLSLYKEAQQIPQPQSHTTKKKVPAKKLNGIQAILEETRRTLEESQNYEDFGDGRTLYFDSNSMNAFANDRMSDGFGVPVNAIPKGVNVSDLAPEVASALTRDYSALMAKLNEKKRG